MAAPRSQAQDNQRAMALEILAGRVGGTAERLSAFAALTAFTALATLSAFAALSALSTL